MLGPSSIVLSDSAVLNHTYVFILLFPYDESMKNYGLKLKSLLEVISLCFFAYFSELSLPVLYGLLFMRGIKNIFLREFHGPFDQPFVSVFMAFTLLKLYLLNQNLNLARGIDEIILPYVVVPLMLSLEGILLVIGLQRRNRARSKTF